MPSHEGGCLSLTNSFSETSHITISHILLKQWTDYIIVADNVGLSSTTFM